MTCSILKPAVHLDNRERNFSYLNGLVKVHSLGLHKGFSFKMHTFWLFLRRLMKPLNLALMSNCLAFLTGVICYIIKLKD